MDIGSLISRNGRFRAEHIAVDFEGVRLTHAEFDLQVNQLANALLRAGLNKGDKLATVLSNCMELLTLYWACAKTGIVIVPLSPLLLPSGLAGLIKDSDSIMVFVAPAHADNIEACRGELEQVRSDRFIMVGGEREGYTPYGDFIAGAANTAPPDAGIRSGDMYNIFYSSGTTGTPKGIVHTHFIRAMYGSLFANAWRMSPESIVLHSGAIIFNGAFLTLLPAFYLGCTFIMHEAFDAGKYIRTIEREKVTHVVLVPSQIVAVLNHPDYAPSKLQSLQMLQSVGAPLHLEVKKQIARDLPGRYYELYGLTEGFFTILDKVDAPRKLASVGCEPPLTQVRIVREDGSDCEAGEVGEIVGRGPCVMPGYYKRPDLTKAAIRDGWLYSGDMGYMDEDGFVYLADRKKDMIISGGVNVYPRDIEEVIAGHEGVQAVAVFGAPDEKWGETPFAAIVLKENTQISTAEMKDWINARVGAKFQRVSHVVFLSDFPYNAAGKILKRELRDRYSQQTASPDEGMS
jgi:acyl-CoA synthetase (AMP-forming)/AMP-acid ligase II